MTQNLRFQRVLLALTLPIVAAGSIAAQLASRPVEEWVKTLDGTARVSALKIDEVVAALKLQPGQIVADIGAGSGLLEVPLAKAVGPTGRVYAIEIDAAFFPEIKKRVDAAKVTNVQTVLGTFTDPQLPVKNIDLALFHDVMHHVEARAAYLKTLAGYLAPTGRIAIVDYEGGQGPHAQQPELQVSREQIETWMKAAGFRKVDDAKLFTDKYVLVYGR
jgi:cyclopropane fatty-acyl-phospholipid synthase-like methyltransferase